MPSSARCSSFFAGQPAAAKREAAQCDNHPDAVGTIRRGTAISISQKRIACPKASLNRRLHRYADPRRARRATAPERVKAFFLFGPCTARFLFGQDRKGAPAALRAVGRGGARERAQFSPQAEMELSGLCDDDNGGHPAGQAPWREPDPRGRRSAARRSTPQRELSIFPCFSEIFS